MSAYNKLLGALIILSVVSYICTVIFNVISAIGKGGLFNTIASNVSDKYPLDVTPAGWTFSIWSVIYIWNGLWIVYVLSTLFRRSKDEYIYAKLGIHPPEFFTMWILNNSINIGWLFIWDKEYLIFSNVFLVLIPITCFMMLQISCSRCYRHRKILAENYRVDLWCTRILVHNGLAMYATWTSIATIINFGMVLKYYVPIRDPGVSSMVLCLVFFALVFWFLMETFVFEKYLRYTFTIYPVAIVATVGVYFGKETSSTAETDVLKVVLISASCIACFLRFTLFFSCGKLRPLFKEAKYDHQKTKVEMKTSDIQTAQINGHTNPIPLEMIESL
ncbi:Hypothetical predicted protein [Pelobates cultripes]|uniref:Uncharacterized protein n=1 Tax=Pelobates cultripes TaxID=61616 RepID=A0AAD1W1E0_PELCU|nr:Hypothetical predicted protein [Pelobates cultripes]